ncbi:MAG TPA: hypothetical protein VNN76_04275 [Bacteroidota bacterium]|nr:hypothetical protein [Bacteroidota bacterium]
MTCGEIDKHLGDAIDGSLPRSIHKEFFDHLNLCPPCRNSYEFELLGKSIVRAKVPRASVPQSLYAAIADQIRRERTATDKRFMERFLPSPVVALGIAVLAVVLLFAPPQFSQKPDPHPPTNDIIGQSLRNFTLIQSGELKPSFISCYPEGVLAYFRESGVRFVVNIMPMENCDWYGAISSEHNGVKLAHVLYKVDDHMTYVYQMETEALKEGSPLQLPAAARVALEQSGWYTDPEHPDHTVVLWTTNGTLCAAVSSMKKDRLLALLTHP